MIRKRERESINDEMAVRSKVWLVTTQSCISWPFWNDSIKKNRQGRLSLLSFRFNRIWCIFCLLFLFPSRKKRWAHFVSLCLLEHYNAYTHSLYQIFRKTKQKQTVILVFFFVVSNVPPLIEKSGRNREESSISAKDASSQIRLQMDRWIILFTFDHSSIV